MKLSYLPVFILFLGVFNLCAQPSFTWINPDTKLHYSLDISNATLSEERSFGHFSLLKNIVFEGVDPKELPANFNLHASKHHGKYTLSIPGTGQVYELDIPKGMLTRIDRTYFRGFNFFDVRFLRKDTLYSIGGEGGWNYHAHVTYFDAKRKEWELVPHVKEGPVFVSGQSAGYEAMTDQVFSIQPIHGQGKQKGEPLELHALDMSTRQWKLLGEMKADQLGHSFSDFLHAVWLDDFFLFREGQDKIMAFPKTNKLYRFRGLNGDFFHQQNELFRQGDWVYSYRKHQISQLDSMKIDHMLASSELIGPMYFPSFQRILRPIGYGLLMLFGLLSLYLNVRWRPRKKRGGLPKVILPEKVEQLLKVFLEKGPEKYLSTEEINVILALEGKTFENIRKQRSSYLSILLKYIEEQFGVPDAIIRINQNSDKRFFQYRLTDEAYQKLKAKLN